MQAAPRTSTSPAPTTGQERAPIFHRNAIPPIPWCESDLEIDQVQAENKEHPGGMARSFAGQPKDNWLQKESKQ
jgi:hypothetical protein